jgi:hypothetical protein
MKDCQDDVQEKYAFIRYLGANLHAGRLYLRSMFRALCQGLRSFDTYSQGSSYANMYGYEPILGQFVHSKVAPSSVYQVKSLVERHTLEPRVRLI